MSKPPKAPKDKGWDILSSMTQPNQSELSFSNFEYLLIDLGIHSAKDRNAILNYAADLKDHIITAHINAEIARTLDRLEQDDAKLTDGRRLELDIPSWVEAERAKLKEVK